jgi:hypothetical protein
MRRKKRIEWYTNKQTLYQVYRSGLEYAFVSKDNKQVCPFVYCKDFLQDAIQGHLHQVKRSIFGFVYDPSKHCPLTTEKTRLLLACSSDGHFRYKIPRCLDFVNQVELKLRMRLTIATECAKQPLQYYAGGIWLLEGSRRWMVSPPMISLYTLLLRIGFVHTIGRPYEDTLINIITKHVAPYQNKDRKQLIEAMDGIKRILKHGDRKIFHRDIKANYPANIPVRIMHNKLGIVGFSQMECKAYMPYWHRKQVDT